MGNSGSTTTISGSVSGACPECEAADSSQSAHIPSRARERRLGASVPRSIHGVTNGKQKLDISVGGKPHSVLIPVCGVANLTQHSVSIPAGLCAGDRFAFTITNEETPDVLVSTLHAIPDYDTLQCKSSSIMQVLLPIVFIRYELPPFMIRLRPLVPPPSKKSRERQVTEMVGEAVNECTITLSGENSRPIPAYIDEL